MLPVGPFLEFCQQNALFLPGQRILAAVSGGRDSVLLAHLLNAAQIPFGIAHMNFQLRGDESLRDEAFVRQLAESFSVPFFTERVDTNGYAAEKRLSTQMAARELRYAWFEKIRGENGFDQIAVAHHRSDVAETMLLNLARGTGISGLHGIRAAHGKIIRPLLFLQRSEIDTLFSPGKIAYVEDSSNAKTDYARNRIRQEVLPALTAINPSLEDTLMRNAARFRETEELLSDTVAAMREALFREGENNSLLIDKHRFAGLRPKQLLAFELLRPFGFSETVVKEIIGSLGAQAGTHFFSPETRLTIDRRELILSPRSTTGIGPYFFERDQQEISDTFFTLKKCAAADFSAEKKQVCIDSDKLIFPLTVRSWQP
ncbi:MAG: tRNA lysidine(34) synthetase TilS, partial [Mucilaginibacter polytrichastri]|nr:tRNA lysidine(34) synthetase TilS [Mucilaginibacter polytrichastri]